jgi:hypothetical protein
VAANSLQKFIGEHREDVIARCRARVATRAPQPASAARADSGVVFFLDHLVAELSGGSSNTNAIAEDARDHGADLRARGFTLSQVVHGYGDICQSVTDLAVEMVAPIATEDFRTLNRCLDDAIASAVTEYSREPSVRREDDGVQTRGLMQMALSAWGAIKAGRVGARGATADVLDRSLNDLSARLTHLASVAATDKPKNSRDVVPVFRDGGNVE